MIESETCMIDRRIYTCGECTFAGYGISIMANHFYQHHRGTAHFRSINPDPDQEAGQVKLL